VATEPSATPFAERGSAAGGGVEVDGVEIDAWSHGGNLWPGARDCVTDFVQR
jgi:hypothetical protein